MQCAHCVPHHLTCAAPSLASASLSGLQPVGRASRSKGKHPVALLGTSLARTAWCSAGGEPMTAHAVAHAG
eukprot:15460286-Alexandrium_andersonii.AAC.1